MSTDSTYPSQSQVPVEWAAIGNTATEAACSVAQCANNRDVLEQCCERYKGNSNEDGDDVTVEELNTSAGLYLTCSISSNYTAFNESSVDNDAYSSFQDCLISQTSGPLLCNRPRNGTSDDIPATPLQCSGNETLVPPGRVGEGNSGSKVCGMRHDGENATDALRKCCGNSTLQAYGLGCFVSCAGDDGLEGCLKDEYAGEGDGGLACIAAGETSAAVNGRQLGLLSWIAVGFAVIGVVW